MKWFDNWFAKQCKKAWDTANKDPDDYSDISVNATPIRRNRSNRLTKSGSTEDIDVMETRECYTIKMQSATGGTVIQISHYDSNKDEWVNDLFVVDDDKDLGQEITSILVQYRLKNM